MLIDIQSRSFPLTLALRNYVIRKVKSALSKSDDHIQKVIMILSDINGPRGGEDKHCHLHIVIPGIRDVVIEDTEEDMYLAIDRATERAQRAVLRKVDRRQTLQKHHLRHMF